MAEPRRPRFRYVVFQIESEVSVSEEAMVVALAAAFPGRVPKLVVFQRDSGIVRCLNTTKDETIRRLNAMRAIDKRPVVVRTIGTSGTIRKAREKYLS